MQRRIINLPKNPHLRGMSHHHQMKGQLGKKKIKWFSSLVEGFQEPQVIRGQSRQQRHFSAGSWTCAFTLRFVVECQGHLWHRHDLKQDGIMARQWMQERPHQWRQVVSQGRIKSSRHGIYLFVWHQVHAWTLQLKSSSSLWLTALQALWIKSSQPFSHCGRSCGHRNILIESQITIIW